MYLCYLSVLINFWCSIHIFIIAFSFLCCIRVLRTWIIRKGLGTDIRFWISGSMQCSDLYGFQFATLPTNKSAVEMLEGMSCFLSSLPKVSLKLRLFVLPLSCNVGSSLPLSFFIFYKLSESLSSTISPSTLHQLFLLHSVWSFSLSFIYFVFL